MPKRVMNVTLSFVRFGDDRGQRPIVFCAPPGRLAKISKNSGGVMTRVLLVGYDPETVDFSNPALPPGMTVEKIRAGIGATLKQMTDRGWRPTFALSVLMKRLGRRWNVIWLLRLRRNRRWCPPASPGPSAVRGRRQRGRQGRAGCHHCFQYAARGQRRCCCPMVAARLSDGCHPAE